MAAGPEPKRDAGQWQEGGQGMIGVIGAGAFGTALATVFARGGARVTLWARNLSRISSQDMPTGVTLTDRIDGLAKAEAI
ncbi:MAG: 2-dehydropantoate 2-reductase N-terminal domain-containing protein, partial [Paracoccaceae bacterium]